MEPGSLQREECRSRSMTLTLALTLTLILIHLGPHAYSFGMHGDGDLDDAFESLTWKQGGYKFFAGRGIKQHKLWKVVPASVTGAKLKRSTTHEQDGPSKRAKVFAPMP